MRASLSLAARARGTRATRIESCAAERVRRILRQIAPQLLADDTERALVPPARPAPPPADPDAEETGS